MEEYAQEPRPWQMVVDCLPYGFIGGGIFQAIKAFRNAPVKICTD
ncbi:unnamed protein product [Gulo gulo]|uniref:Uncharacterized protein n=1 Tax=Gulo gulo TaxID=48420 RepID=A0A9X9LZC8_GULGU|nr:unnamed protein product [Gulo gulo]